MKLVLGAMGFIGSAVYDRLLGSDTEVVVGWNRYEADLELSFQCPKADTIYLCAGRTGGVGRMRDDPLSFVLPNVRIHLNVFEQAAAAGVRRVVCVQSTTGYPDSPEPMREEDYAKGPLHPAYFNPGTAHRFINDLARMFPSLEILFFRPSNVYGPGNDFSVEHSHVIEATVRKVAERQNPLTIWGDGSEVRDAVYIDDLVDAMVMDELPPGAYNIASGEEMRVLEIVRTVCKHAGHDPLLVFDKSKPTAIAARRLNIDKLKSFGWKPKVSMAEGLKLTYDWFRANSQRHGRERSRYWLARQRRIKEETGRQSG